MAMFDKFLRVGDYVINTEMISTIILHDSKIEYDPDGRIYDRDDDMPRDFVSIYTIGPDEAQNIVQFDGDDAEALRWLMSAEASDDLGNVTDFWRDIMKSKQLDKDRGHAE